jgi:hypothetical protein
MKIRTLQFKKDVFVRIFDHNLAIIIKVSSEGLCINHSTLMIIIYLKSIVIFHGQ